MSSIQVVKDEEGQTFIPSSQRPDGSWRKPIRVRDGYVPQEEQPVYMSKGRLPDKPSYPVGLSSNDVQSFPVGYFDHADLLRKSAGIPGLNFVTSGTSDNSVPPKTKKKSKKVSDSNSKKSVESSADSTTPSSQGQGQGPIQTDPTKRLRNLKKRLKEIEDLEKRIFSGELSAPEKEQLEKLKRKDEVKEEIEDLERLLANLGLS